MRKGRKPKEPQDDFYDSAGDGSRERQAHDSKVDCEGYPSQDVNRSIIRLLDELKNTLSGRYRERLLVGTRVLTLGEVAQDLKAGLLKPSALNRNDKRLVVKFCIESGWPPKETARLLDVKPTYIAKVEAEIQEESLLTKHGFDAFCNRSAKDVEAVSAALFELALMREEIDLAWKIKRESKLLISKLVSENKQNFKEPGGEGIDFFELLEEAYRRGRTNTDPQRGQLPAPPVAIPAALPAPRAQVEIVVEGENDA